MVLDSGIEFPALRVEGLLAGMPEVLLLLELVVNDVSERICDPW